MPNSIYSTAIVSADAEQGTSAEDSFADYATTGIASAAISGAVGLYNSMAAIGNTFGAKIEMADEGETVGNVLGSEAQDFYARHKQGIDAAGFLGASIVPYIGATKLVGAAARAGFLGQNLKAAVGLENADYILGSRAMATARKTVLESDTFALKNRPVWQAYAAAARGSALEVAAGESLVLALNNQNAMLNPEDLSAFDSFTKNLGETLTSPLFYGGALLQGGIKALEVTGTLRKIFSSANVEANKLVQNEVGALTGLSAGDKMLLLNDAIARNKSIDVTGASDVTLRRQTKVQEGLQRELIAAAAELNTGNDKFVGELLKNDVLTGKGSDTLATLYANATSVTRIAESDADRLHNYFAKSIIPSAVDRGMEKSELTEKINDLMRMSGYSPAAASMNQDGTIDLLLKFRESGPGYVINDVRSDAPQGIFRYVEDPNLGFKGVIPARFLYTKKLTDADRDSLNAGRRAFGHPEMSKQEWEDYVTLHELSHLKSNRAQAMGRIENSFRRGTPLAAEISRLSYAARPDHWDVWLKANKLNGIEDYIRSSYSAGRPTMVELAGQKPTRYLTLPSELLADAGAMLAGKEAEKFAKMAPNLAKLFKSYGGLKLPWEETKSYYNTRTGKSMTGLMPNLADYREFEIAGNTLRYKGSPTPVRYDSKLFDFSSAKEDVAGLKYDVRQYEEQWAIASKYEFEEGEIPKLAGTDLPMIERAVTSKLPQIEIDGVAMTNGEAESFLLGRKKQLQVEFAQKLRYNEQELGKILNIDPDTAGLGLDTTTKDWLGYSSGRDYTQPENIQVNYRKDPNLSLTEDARSFTTVKLRQNVQKDINQRAAAQVLGEDVYSKTPEMNDIRDLTDADQKQGIFFSLRPEFGTFRDSAAYIGKITQDTILKRGQELEKRFIGAAQNLNHPNNAASRAELATLDSLGNSDKYMFVEMPNGKRFFAKVGNTGFTHPDQVKSAIGSGSIEATEITDKIVGDFMKLHQELELENYGKKATIASAKGKYVTYNPYIFRPAPRDLRYEKHKVFVVPNDVTKAQDGRHFMLFGVTQEELNAKIEAVQKQYGNGYRIVTNKEVGDFKKLEGSYEATGGFREMEFDATKLREFKTGELAPNLDLTSSATLERYRFYHQRQSEAIIRQGMELRYAEEIESLRRDAATYAKTEKEALAKSVFSAERDNIWDDSINTMLAITPNMGAVGEVYHKVSDFIGGMGSKLIDRSRDLIISSAPLDDKLMEAINARMERYGFTSPYQNIVEAALASPETVRSRSFPTMVRFANTLVSTMMLPLDFANSIVQSISIPILLHPVVREAQKSLGPAVTDLISVTVPGTAVREPTPMKLVMDSMRAYWTDEGKQLLSQLRARNLLPDSAVEYREAMDFAGFNGSHGLGQMTAKLDQLRNVAGKFTGYQLSEDLSKFSAAYAIGKIAQMRGIQGEELMNVMSSAIDKVNAVHRVNQRGVFFQGPVGQALGLFQSYTFNWMQNLVRNVQMGDRKNVAIQLALQSSIFGIRSLPGFRQFNEAIGEANRKHEDIYTTTNATEQGSPGQYFLYGLGSHALLAPMDLYNRGDTNPRNALLVPTSPGEIPSVSIVSNVVSNLLNTAKLAMSPDVPIEKALAHGLAHNGLNRPLQGLGAIWAGEVTSRDATSYFVNTNYKSPDGSLLESDPLKYSKAEDLNYAAIATRLLGTKPLQESILLDDKFRRKAYQSTEREKISAIGSEIKLAIEQGEQLTPDQIDRFASSYEAVGGDLENFNSYLNRQFIGANESDLARLQQQMQNDTTARRVRDRMLIERSATPPWEDMP